MSVPRFQSLFFFGPRSPFSVFLCFLPTRNLRAFSILYILRTPHLQLRLSLDSRRVCPAPFGASPWMPRRLGRTPASSSLHPLCLLCDWSSINQLLIHSCRFSSPHHIQFSKFYPFYVRMEPGEQTPLAAAPTWATPPPRLTEITQPSLGGFLLSPSQIPPSTAPTTAFKKPKSVMSVVCPKPSASVFSFRATARALEGSG